MPPSDEAVHSGDVIVTMHFISGWPDWAQLCHWEKIKLFLIRNKFWWQYYVLLLHAYDYIFDIYICMSTYLIALVIGGRVCKNCCILTTITQINHLSRKWFFWVGDWNRGHIFLSGEDFFHEVGYLEAATEVFQDLDAFHECRKSLTDNGYECIRESGNLYTFSNFKCLNSSTYICTYRHTIYFFHHMLFWGSATTCASPPPPPRPSIFVQLLFSCPPPC
jgi:hypothetical protein